MSADSPLVEKFGLVLPSRNAPHSGWPREPQPAPSRARASTSAQPRGVSGQPSASAMGRGIAMTSGVSMKLAASVGAIAGCPASDRCWLSTCPHVEAAATR